MGTILKLYTYFNDLTFTTTLEDDEDCSTLQEAEHDLKDGEKVRIFITSDEEEESYVVTGGVTFKEFRTRQEAESFFFDVQKKPGILYDMPPIRR